MTLSYPTCAANNTTYVGLADTKFLTQVLLGYTAFCVSLTDVFNRTLCQFRTRRTLPTRITTLSGHVRIIVGLSSEEEMRRIDTRWVITSMQYAQVCGDGAVCNVPRHPVGEVLLLAPTEAAIALLISIASPEPTSIRPSGFINLLPEVVLACPVIMVTSEEWDRLALDVASRAGVLRGNWRRLTTAALTKLGAIKAQLDRFLYNSHANASVKGVRRAGDVDSIARTFCASIIPRMEVDHV